MTASVLQASSVLGRRATIREGATRFLRESGQYPGSLPADGVDGVTGTIVSDYTDLPGNDAHYGVMIGFAVIVGVHPDHLEIH